MCNRQSCVSSFKLTNIPHWYYCMLKNWIATTSECLCLFPLLKADWLASALLWTIILQISWLPLGKTGWCGKRWRCVFLHPVKYTNSVLLLQYVHFVYSSSEIHKLCCSNVLHVVFLHFKTKMAFLRFNMYDLCVFIAHRLCIPPVSSSRQKLTDASAPKCIIALLPATTTSTSTSHRHHHHHKHHRCHHDLRYHEMCQFTPSSPSLPSFSAKDLLANKPG